MKGRIKMNSIIKYYNNYNPSQRQELRLKMASELNNRYCKKFEKLFNKKIQSINKKLKP